MALHTGGSFTMHSRKRLFTPLTSMVMPSPAYSTVARPNPVMLRAMDDSL